MSTVDFSPDGKKIVAGSYSDLDNDRQFVHIYDANSGKELQRLNIPRDIHTVYSVAFSPDGKKVAASGCYGFAGIWVLEE